MADQKKTQEQVQQAIAKIRSLRISPQKVNLVLKTIRGKNFEDAILLLSGSDKRIAKDVLKVLTAAAANAENNHDMDIDKLFVREAIVGKSVVMKRFRARARGRGARIFKPMSNVTIKLQEREVAV